MTDNCGRVSIAHPTSFVADLNSMTKFGAMGDRTFSSETAIAP
jgi:hypothetical protein